MRRSMTSFGVPLFGAVLLLVSCADSPPTSPEDRGAVEAVVVPERPGASALMACPTVHEQTASALILPERGGTVSVPGGSIRIPAGAVTRPTTITLTVPRAWYAAVDIQADGRDSFTFQKPVEIEIDYSRCRGKHVEQDHDVGILEGRTLELLQRLDGRDDRAARRIKVDSDHLTTYVVLT